MPIVTNSYSVGGTGIDDCCYLSQRYDEKRGYKPGEDECWVVTHHLGDDGEIDARTHLGTTAWLTGVWRSPSGMIFVSNATDGEVSVNPELLAKDGAKRWKDYELGETLDGIWGLDDKFVLTWAGSWEGQNHLFRFDGKKWHEMPTPEFGIRAIHGLDKDFLYAVGEGGGAARWDGRQWQQFPRPTEEVLNSIFVAGPDEFYATGNRGILLEGSSHGWGKLASCPVPQMPLVGVAKWGDELWVAGGQLGLYKREGKKNKLKLIKPNLKANSFDAREKLLIGCKDFIAETADGKNFEAAGADVVLELRDGIELGDL